ncbi:MAG: SCP2 sterol-binding domain-containing protein, partial [Saprospiraceae bacterium]|nr:SCP2 sterol-binding domain-containing protein [Saprospiraceae bacterium]MCB0679456.1 SCP2 sterol-binding domain-containing protein [Saprospiraceae bacterium]
AGVQTVFHFDLDGPGGGQFTLQVDDGKAEVLEGLQGTPRCTVSGKDEDVMALVDGNVNPLMAILSGKIKISDPGELLKYAKVFGLM